MGATPKSCTHDIKGIQFLIPFLLIDNNNYVLARNRCTIRQTTG